MNSRPLCTSPRCKKDADGNLTPRPTEAGTRLCAICTRILGEDALVASVRYRQLQLVLTGAGGNTQSEKTSGSKGDANLKLNLRAAALRRDIEREIGGMAKLICDQRGFGWPTVRKVAVRVGDGFVGPMPLITVRTTAVGALCRFVARSHQWLAAHERAGIHAGTLREFAVGESFRVAFPGGVRRFLLPGMGPDKYLTCPEATEDGDPCPGVLWTILRQDGEQLPSEILCNGDEPHVWPIREWMRLGRRLMRRAETAGVAA